MNENAAAAPSRSSKRRVDRMRILKHGRPPAALQAKCPHCDCEFTYRARDTQPVEHYTFVYCPEEECERVVVVPDLDTCFCKLELEYNERDLYGNAFWSCRRPVQYSCTYVRYLKPLDKKQKSPMKD